MLHSECMFCFEYRKFSYSRVLMCFQKHSCYTVSCSIILSHWRWNELNGVFTILQLTISSEKNMFSFEYVAGFPAWVHSDVGNLFACCSALAPSQSTLLSSRGSAGYQFLKIDDCWPSAIPGVMDCALLWFVMRHNTSSFLFSIHAHIRMS